MRILLKISKKQLILAIKLVLHGPRHVNVTVSYYHVTCEFQSESTSIVSLNVKEALARRRHHM